MAGKIIPMEGFGLSNDGIVAILRFLMHKEQTKHLPKEPLPQVPRNPRKKKEVEA